MDNFTIHNNAHLSFEELTEYNKGNLSNAEMHRLELHLISCELCNDALDGMQLIEDAQAEKSIAKVVEANQIQEESIFGLYHYIGIAASIVLIAIVSYFFTRSDDQDQLALADNEENPIEKSEDIVDDTISNYVALDSTDISIDSTQLAMAEPESQSTREEPKPAVIAAAEPEVVKPTPDLSSDIANTEADQAISGISDSSLLAEAIVSTDSISAAIIPAEEVQSMAKKAAASPETTPSLASEPDDSAESINLVKAEPPKGSRAFNRYLRRNTNYPDTAKEDGIEGDVELTVRINSDGSIADISVIKSLGYGCDEEAIRLIREGGNWTPASRGDLPVTDTVNVIVTFTL